MWMTRTETVDRAASTPTARRIGAVSYPRDAAGCSPRDVAIALPARNEADSIATCLGALDRAAGVATREGPGGEVRVVVLVNNSDDATAAAARCFVPRAMSVGVEEIVLPRAQAHAGGARRVALDRAAALVGDAPADGGVLMTTDADSVVDPGWIAANLAEIAAGADAVAGVVAFDEATRAGLPPLPLRALEWRLAELHARLASLIDPRPHDPWPNHIWAWGASLALTVSAYRTIGGLPPVPLAEDRALAAAIEAHDLRLRHSHAPVVFTSARLHGRAPGGFADLLRDYLGNDGTLCDAALEPTAALVRRLRRRAGLRAEFAADGQLFGAYWADYERRAPGLVRERLEPAALPGEVALAERLVSGLAARRAGTRASATVRRPSPTVPPQGTPRPPLPRSADSRASAPASGPA